MVIFPNQGLVANFYSILRKFRELSKYAQFAERYLDDEEADVDGRESLYPDVSVCMTLSRSISPSLSMQIL